MTLEQKNTSTLLWGIIGTIVILVGAYVAYAQFLAEDPSAANTEAVIGQPMTKPQVKPAEVQAQVATAASEPATTLVDDSLLKAPVAENETLAKDEIAKLEDVQQQLKEQENSLQQQHKDADDLIKLKEEQIKLLEAQLAQK